MLSKVARPYQELLGRMRMNLARHCGLIQPTVSLRPHQAIAGMGPKIPKSETEILRKEASGLVVLYASYDHHCLWTVIVLHSSCSHHCHQAVIYIRLSVRVHFLSVLVRYIHYSEHP